MLNIKDIYKRKWSYKIYDSCDTLPLFNFIKMLTTGQHKHLVISGNPPQFELIKAWHKISEHYGELSESNSARHVLNCLIDIDYQRNNLIIIQSLIDQMAKGYDERIADLFREMGLVYIYDGEDLKGSLDIIINQTKSMVLDLQERLDEYKALTAGSEKKTTEAEYYLLLADMSEKYGLIDIHRICVTQFIGMYNLYRKKNEPNPGQSIVTN